MLQERGQEGIPQLQNRHSLALPLHSGTREEPQRLIRGTAADRPALRSPSYVGRPRKSALEFFVLVLVTSLPDQALFQSRIHPPSPAILARRCVPLAWTLGLHYIQVQDLSHWDPDDRSITQRRCSLPVPTRISPHLHPSSYERASKGCRHRLCATTGIGTRHNSGNPARHL